jgi:hypothetical protein
MPSHVGPIIVGGHQQEEEQVPEELGGQHLSSAIDEDIWNLIMTSMQLVKLLFNGKPLYFCFGGQVLYGRKYYQVYFQTQQTAPLFDFRTRSYGHFSGWCTSCYWTARD